MKKKRRKKKKSVSIADEWNSMATQWTKIIRNKGDLYREVFTLPATLKILGNIKGKRVLDLGCGEGYNTSSLAKKGPKEIVGIDFSPKMIQLAKKAEQKKDLKIKYYCSDASNMTMLRDSYFDIVISFMAVMDMEALEPVAKEVSRVLRKRGRFIFSINHPCFDKMPGHGWWIKKDNIRYCVIDNYFKREGVKADFTLGGGKHNLGRVTFLHRTLADFINPFADHGLFISKIHEPIPSKQQVKRFPNLAKYQRIPFLLVFEMVKG